MDTTTIKLERETKARLDKLKEHRRESYDEILRKMFYILNIVKVDSDKAVKILERIDVIQKKIGRKRKE